MGCFLPQNNSCVHVGVTRANSMTFELFCPERGCGYRKELKKRDKDYGLGIRYHMGGVGGGGGDKQARSKPVTQW